MLFHYASYDTHAEAERAEAVAGQLFQPLTDRIQGASAPGGVLYLRGSFWYVFHTQEELSTEQIEQFEQMAPSCGHSFNNRYPYW